MCVCSVCVVPLAAAAAWAGCLLVAHELMKGFHDNSVRAFSAVVTKGLADAL